METHSSRNRILRLLRREPRTARELSERIDISPQAVRDQLRSLEREGLAEVARLRRDTGGKPAREFALTVEGEEAFGKSYALLLRNLLGALHRGLDDDAERSLLEAAARRTAEEAAGPALPDPVSPGKIDRDELAARLEAAADALNALGGAATVAHGPGGEPEIRSDGCPLSAVVRDEPEACLLAELLVTALTGVEVVEACDRSGRPRCRFGVGGGPGPF